MWEAIAKILTNSNALIVLLFMLLFSFIGSGRSYGAMFLGNLIVVLPYVLWRNRGVPLQPDLQTVLLTIVVGVVVVVGNYIISKFLVFRKKKG